MQGASLRDMGERRMRLTSRAPDSLPFLLLSISTILFLLLPAGQRAGGPGVLELLLRLDPEGGDVLEGLCA